jgi:ATP-dependent Lhr-like helicase
MDVASSLHPAVRRWFEERFPDGPSPPQASGWPAIQRRENTLIAAPTGSGKTLAAFLICIDELYRRGGRNGRHGRDARRRGGRTRRAGRDEGTGELFRLASEPDPELLLGAISAESRADGLSEGVVSEGVEVLYVSPLKALAADIQQNLATPLAEIDKTACRMGLRTPAIRVGMRSGDTTPAARAAMLKKPPQILVTTPESLYLLLTSARGREILRPVRTVIVDEIHALARDKRGSHLALSLERLEACCHEPPVRIGLSATQRPIEALARLLVGSGRPCTIVDEGHRRALDLGLVLPGSELEAVASGEQMAEILDGIAEQVGQHRTTLVFVNTRRMAERLAHQLAERLGEEGVAAHHGSLSKQRRLRVESALREGRLRALVATASLELGIDVGPVELVCQIGSPRAIATFLQRVGRSGHFRGGLPKGRLYPLTRDELVECAGLLRGVRAGRLDRVRPPVAPLDILAQQIVAACAAEPWKEDELYALVCRAAPFEALARETFDEVVALVADGIETGRGRRAAYVHHDRIGRMLRARRGARLAALTSGGAIPEVADYRVVADPDETFIGSVGEDFAIDSLPGDVFLLGSTSWRIRRVEAGVVRVVDAEGASPNIPFWAGEAPARTEELSDEVSALREVLDPILARGDEAEARRWLEAETGIGADAAIQIARYLGVSRAALGALPTRDRLVLERFFDDAGGMQLVIHSPRGGRLNRALCLGLRKKFCKSFNFELQAAAGDDALVLSLGPHHSFPLADVPHFLTSRGLEETLCQAILPTPLFTARWRWNLNRSLAVLRFRNGKKNPPAIQRMESDDLMAAVFPQAAACQENVAGPIEIPDHPLVRQTMHDCLTDAMDAAGLAALVGRIEQGTLEIHCVDTTEPSPLAHEILNGKPFTFLDDAPLEERRTRAVKMRRGLPVEQRDLSRLDGDAIAKVRAQAEPSPRDAEELHDLLLGVGLWRAEPRWQRLFLELEARGRAFAIGPSIAPSKGGGATGEGGAAGFWVARERAGWARALHPEAWTSVSASASESAAPGSVAGSGPGLPDVEGTAEDEAIAHALRGHLETTGPIGITGLAARLGVRTGLVEIGVARLEAEGFVLRGRFEQDDGSGAEQLCARRLLARIHADTQGRRRASIEPVSARDLMRFLLEWQHVASGSQLEGPLGVAQVVEQLQGFELAAGAWESAVLTARVRGYRPEWLDAHCLSGRISWLRLATPAARTQGGERLRPGRGTSRAMPLSLVMRDDLGWLLQAHRGSLDETASVDSLAERICTLLGSRGALFLGELVSMLGVSQGDVEMALWELVGQGRVGADGIQALRGLLAVRARRGASRIQAEARARRGLRRGLGSGPRSGVEGRWSRLPACQPVEEPDEVAEAVAEQLLQRWGIVFRDIVARESLAIPWREIVWALRRFEARGTVRGGRFVSGFTGEQFALPEAVDGLARVRARPRTGERVRLCGSDPLNLIGILTPGERVPARRTRELVLVDGLLEPEAASQSARPTRPEGPGPRKSQSWARARSVSSTRPSPSRS